MYGRHQQFSCKFYRLSCKYHSGMFDLGPSGMIIWTAVLIPLKKKEKKKKKWIWEVIWEFWEKMARTPVRIQVFTHSFINDFIVWVVFPCSFIVPSNMKKISIKKKQKNWQLSRFLEMCSRTCQALVELVSSNTSAEKMWRRLCLSDTYNSALHNILNSGYVKILKKKKKKKKEFLRCYRAFMYF